MSSPHEQTILMLVLGSVLASLPVAALLRRRSQPSPAVDSPLPVPPPLPYSAPGPDVWSPPVSPIAPAPPPPLLPHHGWWQRRDAWFALALLLIVSVLMGPLASMGMAESGAEPAKLQLTPQLFTVQLIFQFGMVGIVMVYLAGHRRFNVVQLFGLNAMGPFKTVGTSLLWIIPGFIGIMLTAGLVVALIEHFTGMKLQQQAIVEGAKQITDPQARVLLFLTLCVGAPVMEELVFRGVFFSVGVKFLGRGYALIASGLFFAVIHSNLLSLVPLTLLGILFAIAYEKTRTLAVPVLMHAFFNGTQFVLLMYSDEIQKLVEQAK